MRWAIHDIEHNYRNTIINLLTEIRDLLKEQKPETKVTQLDTFECSCGKTFKSEHGLKIHQAKCKGG